MLHSSNTDRDISTTAKGPAQLLLGHQTWLATALPAQHDLANELNTQHKS